MEISQQRENSNCSAFYQDGRPLDSRALEMTGEDRSAEQDAAPTSMLVKSRRFGGRGAW
ncbi:MAG: hypothetical protein JO189_06830 [Deltaproteobacteria bacterium]|nr:hypothetical protein [Deltaproteobacteria bacterium]